MSLFPQLLAGPICRSRELLPQIMADAPNRIERPAEAIALIASGIFKKVVLASYLSTHMVDEAFQIPTNYSSLELLVALFAYTVEVYLDFSGYTDMARGLGLLLGFRLPENFRHPYAASNIGEFWNRWHITFSTWLRDYIYFPLGGSRRSRLRTYANLIITFLICGIWHGPRWGFVIWGLLHGIALALYKFSVDLRRDHGRDPKGPHPWWWRAAGCVSTITFCAFARIFFRTEDISTAWEFFEGLGRVSMHGVGIDAWLVAITIFGFGMNFFGRTCYDQFLRTYERLPTITRPVLWAAISLAVLTFKTRDVSPHIYFGF
jgi:D-alanyl-lipoteichoic acid acyltransferase DltB (MBOAT superfamily)